MTTREWQHAGYVRDRWQVNPKLTVDVGLRYEYYPLMQRADRGIEQVDLSNLTVKLGGLGGNPTDLGIKVSKTLFAPRLGAVYRINEDTVVRSGYGITYNPLPFSRPLRGFYPLTLAADYNAPNPYAWATTLAAGIPDVVGPDLSSGTIPLPNAYGMRTPRDDVSRSRIHSWNVSFERRLPKDISLDVAYVGTAKNGGFADININASDTPGGGVASQPLYAAFGRQNSLELWGPLTKSRYNSLQVAVNRPFKNGLLLKGAYTWSHAKNETDDDGWAGLTWNGAEPVEPQLCDRRLRSAARLSDGVRLRAALQVERDPAIARRTGCSATGRSTASTARMRARRSRSPRAAPRSTCPVISRRQI